MPAVALGIGLLGTGASIRQAQKAESRAEEQAEVQRQQARLQQRLQEARSRRQARIRAAQIQATAGAAGVTGAIIEAPLTGIETAAATQTELLQQQTEAQIRQFGIQQAQTATQAEAQIAGAIGSFAATALSPASKKGETLIESIFD